MQSLKICNRLKLVKASLFLSLFFSIQVIHAQTTSPTGATDNLKISLECHQTLNPKLWDADTLKPEVRQALLKFAERFAQFTKISPDLIQDVVMVGGNANYNYTKNSDIDAHILLDRNKLGTDRAMVDDYVQLKKEYWSLTHDIKIYGYDIEPYVEDLTTLYSKDKGIYSIKNNVWLQKPVQAHCTTGDTQRIIQKVNQYKKEIDETLARQPTVAEAQNLMNKIKLDRQKAIRAGGGEFDFENLVFKELRAQGYVDKLIAYMKKLDDKQLSLPSQ